MAKSGGGITSNKLVHPGVRTGAPREGINPGYAGQIGGALGNKVMNQGKPVTGAAEPMYGVAPYKSALGNEVAGNVGKGGPGTGRTVHRSGSQAQHGAATGNVGKPSLPADILSHYGPERRS